MVELRNFTVDDAERLHELYYRDMPIESIRRTICEWNRLEYQGKYFEIFAILFHDKIAGELSLYEHSKSVVSIGLEVFPEFQSQGYGKQAMLSALKICRDKGYRIVCDQVRTENEPSIALHDSLGFESDRYRYINQKGTEVYLFLKAL